MNLIIGSSGLIATYLLKKGGYKTTSSKKDTGDFFLDLINAEQFNYEIINKEDKVIFLGAISSPEECNINFKFNILRNWIIK